MVMRVTATATLIVACSAVGHAAQWSGYATIGSDYVYRGVSLIESGASLQGGIEAHVDDHFIGGAEAVRVDHQWAYEGEVSEHAQLGFYTGMEGDCGAHCRARVIASRYVFPGSAARDWSEITASMAFFQHAGIALSWSPRGLGTRASARTLESWLQHPLARDTTLDIAYGQVLIGNQDYWYAHAGVSHRIDRLVIGLTGYWSDRDLRHFASDHSSQHLVLTLSTGF